jgi:hypothetical protein
MVNEARTRVESMLHGARTTAQAVERRSREKAMSLVQQAARKHAEILELNQVKSLLENAIFDLQAFEQEPALRWQSMCCHCLTSWTGPDPPPRQTRYVLDRILLAPGWAHAVKPVNPRSRRDEPDTVETSWEGQFRPPAARVRSCGLMILGSHHRTALVMAKIWVISHLVEMTWRSTKKRLVTAEIRLSSSRPFSPLLHV